MKKNYSFSFFLLIIFFGSYISAQEKVIEFSKGMWHTGITLSALDADDENIDNVVYDVVKNQKNGFEANILGGYFIKDNMSVGMQYEYSKSERDLIYETDDGEGRRQVASSNHTITGFLRNYYPITANNRFSFYNETDLSVGFGNSNTRRTKSETDITKTFSDETNFELGLKPGIAVVLIKGFAFEVGVDLLGLNYTNSRITKDGVKEGKSSEFNFDFKISLLSLDFGLAYYF